MKFAPVIIVLNLLNSRAGFCCITECCSSKSIDYRL